MIFMIVYLGSWALQIAVWLIGVSVRLLGILILGVLACVVFVILLIRSIFEGRKRRAHVERARLARPRPLASVPADR